MNAKITGVLFITATVAGILSAIFLGPVLDATDFLSEISANESQILIAAFFELIMAISVASIAISMYPVLKKFNLGMALGSVCFRVMEGVLFMVGVLCLLLLTILSKEYVDAGAPINSYFQILGEILAADHVWTIGGIAFCIGALLYYTLFYQTKLVPRWLSIFGLLAILLALTSYLVQFFSFNVEFIEILHLPTLVQEMVFAVWLIIKGYDPSVINSESE